VDRLEQQLRSTFADERLNLPLRPGASHLVRAGVRRRRRNRAIASLAAVVVLAAGGVATGSLVARTGGPERIVPPTGGGHPSSKPSLPSPTQDEIAWDAAAYDYHAPPVFPGAIADSTVPWCRAGELSLSQLFQGAGGSLAGTVSVTNTSSATCALQGQPAVAMQTADGKNLLSSRPEPFFVDAWISLAPGHSASAAVTWFPEFCHEPGVGRIGVTLPHLGGSLSTAMTGSPRCDVDTVVPLVGHLDVGGFVTRLDTPFTALAGLQARLDRVPTSAFAGAVLTYRLQLQSMRAASVPLDPCLPYRERLVDHTTRAVLSEQDFLLNCGLPPVTVSDPESRHSTFFDLRLDIPATAPAGEYDLVWQSVLKPVNAVSDRSVHVQSGPPPCRDGQVSAVDGPKRQAMNQYGHTVVLANASGSACSLRGYPGVRLVDTAGARIGKDAARGGGYVFPDPGPATVVLPALTGKASFTFGGPAMTGGGQVPCPTSAAALVFPPGMRVPLRVAMIEPYCEGGISTSAVVAGTQGARFS
jgi:hypothetical protein